MLFKEFAGIDAFPICLANQDTNSIVETVKQIAPVFGGVNLEDIAAPRCFEIESLLRQQLDIPFFTMTSMARRLSPWQLAQRSALG